MGTQVDKVTPSWRLSAILRDLQGHISSTQGVTFQVVHRTTNKLDDALANAGIQSKLDDYHILWQDMEDGELKAKCNTIKNLDLQS